MTEKLMGVIKKMEDIAEEMAAAQEVINTAVLAGFSEHMVQDFADLISDDENAIAEVIAEFEAECINEKIFKQSSLTQLDSATLAVNGWEVYLSGIYFKEVLLHIERLSGGSTYLVDYLEA